MENITQVLLGISVMFFVLLGIKAVFKEKLKKLCVICASVSLTWIFLLILYFLERFENLTLIALLMGGTVVGLFYLWERKTKKQKLIFRLPVLMTFLAIAYFILTKKILIGVLVLIAVLWLIFSIIYLYRKNKNFNSLVNKIVECCKKW